MTTEETQYHLLAGQIDGAEKSQLFGKPCYKILGKAFCCFFQNEMVFKLSGETYAEALSLDGAQLFDPSGKGRPMKEWVQLPIDYEEYWAHFAEQAATYVKLQNSRLQ